MKEIFVHLIKAAMQLIMSMVTHMISKKSGGASSYAQIKGIDDVKKPKDKSGDTEISVKGTNGDIKVFTTRENSNVSASATGKNVSIDV